MVYNMNTGFNGSCRVAKNNTFSDLQQFLILKGTKLMFCQKSK